LQDPEKQRELVEKINTAAKETSWEVTAVKHLEVYKN
jgi:hypothetical protein